MIHALSFIAVLSAVASGASAAAPAGFSQYATCNQWVSLNDELAKAVSGSGAFHMNAAGTSSYGYLNVSIWDAADEALDASSPLVAHIHADVCENNNGGGHWRANPDSTVSNTTNEFHFMLPALVNGSVARYLEVTNDNFGLDERIKSVVVHASAGNKTACCNIVLTDDESSDSSSESSSDETSAAMSAAIHSSMVVFAILALALF